MKNPVFSMVLFTEQGDSVKGVCSVKVVLTESRCSVSRGIEK